MANITDSGAWYRSAILPVSKTSNIHVPAEAMQEFFDRFENALQADPEAMLAA